MFSPQQQHVLYYENDDDTRFIIKMTLEQSGFRVTATGDARQCLEHMKNHPDLILLEQSSFGLSGLALCLTIREFDLETPILFFSSHAYAKDRTAALQAGAQGYLVKPNDLSRISSEVSRLIGESKTAGIYYSPSNSLRRIKAEVQI